MNDFSEADIEPWRKSSFSQNGDCVEVAFSDEGIFVRNSRRPRGGVLEFNDREWLAFLAGVRHGEFDKS